MAKIIPRGTRWESGRLGKDLIIQKLRGTVYIRVKPIPTYTNTPRQAQVRRVFAEAVRGWQRALPIVKTLYRYAANGKGMSGYELFIKLYVESNY